MFYNEKVLDHCSVLCPAALRLAILDYILKLKRQKLEGQQAEN